MNELNRADGHGRAGWLVVAAMALAGVLGCDFFLPSAETRQRRDQLQQAILRLVENPSKPTEPVDALAASIDARLTAVGDFQTAWGEIIRIYNDVFVDETHLDQIGEVDKRVAGTLVLVAPDGTTYVTLPDEAVGGAQKAHNAAKLATSLDVSGETVVLYVNGIWTTFPEMLLATRTFAEFIRDDGLGLPELAIGGLYNFSFANQCVRRLRVEDGEPVLFNIPSNICARWLGDDLQRLDFVTTLLTFSGYNSQATDDGRLAAAIELLIASGKRVIVVAHSDGNQVLKFALDQLQDLGRLTPDTPLAVLMLGSPVRKDALPVLPAERVRLLCLSEDVIAALGLLPEAADDCPETANRMIDLLEQFKNVPPGSDIEIYVELTGEVLATFTELLAGGCFPDCIVNSNGQNQHEFVDNYLGGEQSRTAILSALHELAASLPPAGS